MRYGVCSFSGKPLQHKSLEGGRLQDNTQAFKKRLDVTTPLWVKIEGLGILLSCPDSLNHTTSETFIKPVTGGIRKLKYSLETNVQQIQS
jgi:hypothetical protein